MRTSKSSSSHTTEMIIYYTAMQRYLVRKKWDLFIKVHESSHSTIPLQMDVLSCAFSGWDGSDRGRDTMWAEFHIQILFKSTVIRGQLQMQSFLKQYFVKKKFNNSWSVLNYSIADNTYNIFLWSKFRSWWDKYKWWEYNQTRISFINQYFVAVLDMNLYWIDI